MSSDEKSTPRYALELGTGVPLGALPCFQTVPTRRNTAASNALEAALEPVHRIVYNRPGVSGYRRKALQAFKGFPDEAEDYVKERVGGLKKDKLCLVVRGLGIRQPVSAKAEVVAEAVVSFLMAPRDDGVIKVPKETAAERSGDAAAAAGKKRGRDAAAACEEKGGSAKRAKSEGVHVDTVRVAVFRRVLAMTPEERTALSAKALRTELEAQLGLEEGGLKEMKEEIVETAALAVRSLLAAEERAAAAAPPAASPAAP